MTCPPWLCYNGMTASAAVSRVHVYWEMISTSVEVPEVVLTQYCKTSKWRGDWLKVSGFDENDVCSGRFDGGLQHMIAAHESRAESS